MKKFWIVLVAALVVAVALIPNAAFAYESDAHVFGERKSDVESSQNDEIYEFVQQLCERNASDTASARSFLVEEFGKVLGVEVEQLPFKIGDTNFVNLQAKLNRNSDKQIIIGAHYDSVGEGAGDNACGIAALYRVMQLLAKNASKLPYNVVFVAFDGEEKGLLGSYDYLGKMTIAERDSTLVMFNIDTIATGDNLYVMCENKSTDLADLILNKSKGFQEKPHAVGVYGAAYDQYGYGYYEMVQNSDHTPFRLAGIPVALLFSGTYSARFWSYAESANTSSVMNSASDTFANLTQNYPDFTSRIETVARAVADTVQSSEFTAVAENARKQLVNLNFWYNITWPLIAVAVIAIAAVVFAVLYNRKLQKNALMGETEIKTNKVFDKPDADEIFSYKTDDSDDIFTFKK